MSRHQEFPTQGLNEAQRREGLMQAKDVMTTKPSYCEPYWTVEAVASLMDHVGTGILPIVEDALSRRLIGVVTDRDICVRIVAPGLYPAHIWVKDCMTPHPICCRAEDDIEKIGRAH